MPRATGAALCALIASVSLIASTAFAQPCVVDVNGDGYVDGADAGLVFSCYGSPGAPECAPADINGDGNVDGCDFAMLDCGWDGAPTSDCCETVRCGACELPESCLFTSRNVCERRDSFLRDCMTCRPRNILPPACVEPPVTEPPPDAAPPPDEVPTFRGGGGCTCRTAPTSTEDEALLLILAAFGGALWRRAR